MEITLYNLRVTPPDPCVVDVDALMATMRGAAYRFWLSERRMPAAVVVCLQMAHALTASTATHRLGALHFYGSIALDESTTVPLIAREAFSDPLFQFI